MSKGAQHSEKELVFVYNARSDTFNRITDFAHKLLSPKTYPCSLCKLTYGNFSEHQEWTEYIKSLNYTVRFLYKNQIEEQQHRFRAPMVVLRGGSETQVILTASELEKIGSLDELITQLKRKL